MVQGLKERVFIKKTFGRYVDEDIAKELIKRPEAAMLGGERREVAILMSDLRNFKPLSQSLNAEETIRILNRYFSFLIEIIQTHKGIIGDFFGDGILVFFDTLNGPVVPSVKNAICCALDMQKQMESFKENSRRAGLPELHMGIGVNA